jgi:Putative DNA-binding domain
MSTEREAQRQQQLLRTLWRADPAQALQPWAADEAARFNRGLQAYQTHAGAMAQRALAAAYPTVQQLLGDEPFGALARALWRQHPPEHGDVDTWGAALGGFIARAPDLADERYLPDVARLEWAVHLASRAADDDAPPAGLHRLADTDPAGLWLRPRAGTALVVSPYPVLMLWQAHQPDALHQPDRFGPVRQALAQGLGQAALVWRQGSRVQVDALDPAETALCQAVLNGHSLAQALEDLAPGGGAAPAQAFEPWLLRQLRRGWLAGAAVAAQGAV